MKKFSVLIALALLAVAGTGYAVTCAYDNVPAATLLVPHFRVSRNGSTGGDIPAQGVDTLCSITNVSSTGVMTHFVVWNKYSAMVVDFNVPLTAFDVATFSMRDILNGHINVNKIQQTTARSADPCGLNQLNVNAAFAPSLGFGATKYIRFTNPDPTDRKKAISVYADPAWPAGSLLRQYMWDSLDESQDITSFTASTAAGILDVDNPACEGGFGDTTWAGDFSGYLTIDVVNYCTLWSEDAAQFYLNDAIATNGWAQYGYTPNVLMGDVFYLDPSVNGGNISGDPMVPMEYDYRLNNWDNYMTFFGKYRLQATGTFVAESLANYQAAASGVSYPGSTYPLSYTFIGDGREPLGSRYGFRYLADPTAGLMSWAIIWRSDVTTSSVTTFGETNLCQWWADGGVSGEGFYDSTHQITAYVFDNDESQFQPTGGCPSPCGGTTNLYVFLETQRYALAGNSDINPSAFKGGWIDMTLPGWGGDVAGSIPNFATYQAYVGIQHTGPGLAISVGHGATLLNEQFLCRQATGVAPVFAEAGNVP